MNRAEVLQEVRLMKFEDVYSRRTADKLTQEQAAEILGVSVRTVRRWEDRFEADGAEGLCCTNQLRDSLYESSVVAGGYEQLVPYEVQDQELAFVQHGAKAARFAINLV